MATTQTTNIRITRFKVRQPRRFNVIMHNDDVTTMEFVVMVLQSIFHKKSNDAENIMLKIHNEGQAVVGTYSLDIAKTKVRKVTILARTSGYPLELSIEEE